MIKLKYFELDEFLKSETALAKRIENLPTFEIIENLYELACALDGLRESWKKPIIVSSGYRSYELNKAVGRGDNQFTPIWLSSRHSIKW